MHKITLNKQQVSELILANQYKVDSSIKFISRCIDGRYPNDPGLPALALPGADMGELAVIFSASQTYGFEVDPKRTYEILAQTVGGEENISCHTSTHGSEKVKGECGYLEMLADYPEIFNVEKSLLEFINQIFSKCSARKNTLDLKGDHLEAAVLMIRGDYGVYPQFRFSFQEEQLSTQVFVFHQSLVDARHRTLVGQLIKNKGVVLLGDTDEEYLYEVISNTCEDHFFETIKPLAPGLPIYHVEFSSEGKFKIEDGGFIHKA